MACNAPPTNTRPARNAASEAPAGNPTAIKRAIDHWRTATLTNGPRQIESPVMYPQNAIIGTSIQGAAAAVLTPTNVDMAIPILASTTAATRLRVSPWNEAIPAGRAPSATYAPY